MIAEDQHLRSLAEWIKKNDRRLVVMMVGQLREPLRAWEALKVNLLDHCEHLLVIQCPVDDAARAAKIYDTHLVDGWDPSTRLPAFIRWAWPVFGNSGRLAVKTKPSFYFQMLRQRRAAKVFAPSISNERDLILKWRPDLVLFAPVFVPDALVDDCILLPEYENHGGFNDQCALGRWSKMMAYLNRLDRISDYLWESGIPHAETFLKWVLRHEKVGRMSICYAIDRGDRFNHVKISAKLGDRINLAVVERLNALNVEVVRTAETVEMRRGHFGIPAIWQKAISLFSRFGGL